VTRLIYVALAAALLGAAVGRLTWGWAFEPPTRYGWTVVTNEARTGLGVRWGVVDAGASAAADAGGTGAGDAGR
jgi:hypothetical protein